MMQREKVPLFLPMKYKFCRHFALLLRMYLRITLTYVTSMPCLLVQNVWTIVKSVSMTGDARFWKTNDRRKCSRWVKESNGGAVGVFKSHWWNSKELIKSSFPLALHTMSVPGMIIYSCVSSKPSALQLS